MMKLRLCRTTFSLLLLLLVGQAFAGTTRIPNFSSASYKAVYQGQRPPSYLPYWHGFHFWNGGVGGTVVPQLTYWTEHLYKEVSQANNLLTKNPTGIRHFCPNYVNLNREKRILFWTRLISIMAAYESSYNPRTTYNEPSMPGVRSGGLLQISALSSAIPEYKCSTIIPSSASENRALLKQSKYKSIVNSNILDPKKNLSCGVRIIDYWIGRDGVMVDNIRDTDGIRYWRGLARYWGVFRHPSLKTNPSSYYTEISGRRSKWQENSRKRDSLIAAELKKVRAENRPWGHTEWKARELAPHPSLLESRYENEESHPLTAILRLANQTAFCF